MRTTVFLPLTLAATSRLAACLPQAQARGRAVAVRRSAEVADAAAGDCWTALLGGCDTAALRGVTPRLRGLSEATSQYVGARWWAGEGASYRRRVAQAQLQIDDAIAEGDGSEFARAFVGYDHAVASTVVCAHRYAGSERADGA